MSDAKIDAIDVAFDEPMAVGECPLWNPAESCLYWVDIDGFAIHRLHPASGLWNHGSSLPLTGAPQR